VPPTKPFTAIVVPSLDPLDQEPLVIAAGAIGACEVPIRTVATSVSVLRFPDSAPNFGGDLLLLDAFIAIKLKPVKPNK
jgi:hypothetical protein